MEHISEALARGLEKVARRQSNLAPLDPDQFLRWAWNNGDKAKGTGPLTLEDLHFELGRGCPEITMESLRLDYRRLAETVRRNQQMDRDPYDGIR